MLVFSAWDATAVRSCCPFSPPEMVGGSASLDDRVAGSAGGASAAAVSSRAVVSLENGACGGGGSWVGSWSERSEERPSDAVVCEVSARRNSVVTHILGRVLVRVRRNEKLGIEVQKSPCAVLVNFLHKRMSCVTGLDGGMSRTVEGGRGVQRVSGKGERWRDGAVQDCQSSSERRGSPPHHACANIGTKAGLCGDTRT